MSTIQSLYTGVSGLSSNGEAISITGDNIANAGTVGYKGSRANFEDLLSSSLNKDAIGNGARLSSVEKMMDQGGLSSTGVSTDLAIEGDGWFAVRGRSSGMDGLFYTRAGQFELDKEGKLVNDQGLSVMGYNVDKASRLISHPAEIQVSSQTMAPKATTTVELKANLDAGIEPISIPWDPKDPLATSNFSTNVDVYDSLGNQHQLNVCFRKEASGNWNWYALVDGGEIAGGTPGEWTEQAAGTLSFDTEGHLLTESTTYNAFSFVGAEPGQTIHINFGDAMISEGGTGLKGVTNFAGANTVTDLHQDGFSSASLAGIAVDVDGKIYGAYDNGLKRLLGQVVLAKFQAPEELQRVGGTLFVETVQSGQAIFNAPTTGGLGAIKSNSLESANIDLSRQFVDMITFQRAYQANSKVVSNADAMLQSLISIVR